MYTYFIIDRGIELFIYTDKLYRLFNTSLLPPILMRYSGLVALLPLYDIGRVEVEFMKKETGTKY